MQVLLVEDDSLLGQAVQLGLADREFSVHWVRTGAAAISELNHHQYDAMVLDLGLPDLEGSRILAGSRKRGLVLPILILTARDQAHDKVTHLDLGADDYMTKPFDMNELAARLRALVRRQRGYVSSDLVVGALKLNTNTREVEAEGQTINLSRREFELLKALMSAPERVHSRDRLESAVFQAETEVESNALEVHVSNLRKKLGHKEWIETIRGVGYRLTCK
ncbi:DNA-binding response regulator [Pseudidiomarina gelatinasegens]|uniref:DNA-binding response regulator n=1 Tax=Pseudidiomarina gelatinasegens TaxID=2487740 RepID=A0A451GEU4_9GAMM|nr:response regulator transcription factor [Pseudidiomarina gelatinasegens]RWU11626.1 DNA-binding response regulator [Pseudidiomarina gelatinasegens]|tara:strand:+ start:21 stop:683 length:663 start_codon:yes stop_codon:yes gene_type:complete